MKALNLLFAISVSLACFYSNVYSQSKQPPDASKPELPVVHVIGQVKNQPAKCIFRPKMTLTQAIAAAGGFGDFADKRKVKVVRGDPRFADHKTFVIDLSKAKDDPKSDFILEAGDTVFVPQRLINGPPPSQNERPSSPAT